MSACCIIQFVCTAQNSSHRRRFDLINVLAMYSDTMAFVVFCILSSKQSITFLCISANGDVLVSVSVSISVAVSSFPKWNSSGCTTIVRFLSCFWANINFKSICTACDIFVKPFTVWLDLDCALTAFIVVQRQFTNYMQSNSGFFPPSFCLNAVSLWMADTMKIA